MDQNTFLANRNKLFLHLYIIGIAGYIVAFWLDIFPFFKRFPYEGIVFAAIAIGLCYSKISPKAMQITLLVGGNIAMVIFNYYNCHYIGITWCVLFILLASVYESIHINIAVSVAAIIESIILLKLLPQKITLEITSVYYLLFTLSLMTILACLQFYLLKRSWRSMEVMQDSKEKQLAWSDAYLELFFNSAKDSIAVFDLNGRIIQVNPAFEELYGWKREECIGKILPLVPHENQLAAKIRQKGLMKGESYSLLETQDQRKDGSYFDAQISLSPILNEQGEVMATSVISRDISYQKENERLIVETEKLNLAGELAAGLAHEIRNPMTVISGFIQMMSADTASPYHTHYATIKKEIERVDLIIEEFLILSTPQALAITPFYLDEVLQETCDFLTLSFERHSIDFELQCELAYCKVQGNANQIKQVLLNLLKNAIEALEHSTHKKITARLYKKQNTLRIAITDTGCGIDEQTLQHIFSPFYTTKPSGTGLGMIITNKIMQEHGGQVLIESVVDVGTTITIVFPLPQ